MIELMPHQMKFVEKARERAFVAAFMDPGTGKTGAVIRALAEWYNAKGGLRKTIIFAPKSVCGQWPDEFAKFSGVPKELVFVLTGTGAKRIAAMTGAIRSSMVVVTNYEAVQIEGFYKLLLKWSPEAAVLDESHRIKDASSKRAKRIYPLISSCERRFIMTGTPVLNSLLDIFGQYRALDPKIFGPSFFAFRSKYFRDKNAGKPFGFPDWQPGVNAAEHIGRTISDTSVQAKREECLSLPPLQVIPVKFDISGAQKKAYDEMKKNFVTEVGGVITSSEFEMVKTIRMQQILAGFIQPDEGAEPKWFDDQPRLDALMDKIETIGTAQAIIWTVFKPTYEKIAERLKKEGYKYAFFTGVETDKEKAQAKRDFIDGRVQFLIANTAAAGEGVDGLQVARYAFFFMRGHNLLHFLQSLARNYRSGSEKHHVSVAHYHFIARDTLDEVIAWALRHKQSVGDTALKWARGDKMSLALEEDMGYGGIKE